MVSEHRGRRMYLERVEAALATLQEEVGFGSGIDEAVAAVAELRRALDSGETPAVGRTDDNSMIIIGHLAAAVAHEINNLLFVIRGSAELARLNLGEDDPLQTRLTSIDEAVDRAKDLTAMILHTARRSGSPPPPIPLHPVVKEAVKLTRAALGDDLQVRQHVLTDTSPMVVDPIEAYRLVLSLLRCVSKILAEKDGLLAVTLDELETEDCNRSIPDASGRWLLLAVASAVGEGAEEAVDRLADRSGDRKQETSEGVEIPETSVNIVRNLGGHIAGYVVPGGGIYIEVLLPLLPQSAVT
jgi:signal transduction histidine kinase